LLDRSLDLERPFRLNRGIADMMPRIPVVPMVLRIPMIRRDVSIVSVMMFVFLFLAAGETESYKNQQAHK